MALTEQFKKENVAPHESPIPLCGIPLRMKTEAVGRAASPLAADGAHGVTRPTHLRGNREVVLILILILILIGDRGLRLRLGAGNFGSCSLNSSARNRPLPMNRAKQSGRGLPHSKTLRALDCGWQGREVPRPRESASVYRRFGFMAPGQFKKEQVTFHEHSHGTRR